MKVLVIWRRLSVGGINTGWRNRAKYFAKHGIQTEFLFCKNKGGAHLFQDVAPYIVTNNPARIKRHLRRKKYDCIIVIDFKKMLHIVKKAKVNAKLIIESRVPIPFYVRRQLQLAHKTNPAAIVVPSRYQRSLVKKALAQPIPTKVIYNALDRKHFKPQHVRGNLKNELQKLPSNKKMIAWVGRLYKRKKWEDVLRVAAKMVRKRTDIVFCIVGGKGSNEVRRFRTKIRQFRLQKHVIWLPLVRYAAMPILYAQIAQSGGCLFSTTKHESFGNTFIEAMACRCPVVAPNHTAIPEVVLDKRTGLLYQPGNVTNAVGALQRILDDRSLRDKLINNGEKRVLNHFTIEKNGKTYVELLRALTNIK